MVNLFLYLIHSIKDKLFTTVHKIGIRSSRNQEDLWKLLQASWFVYNGYGKRRREIYPFQDYL